MKNKYNKIVIFGGSALGDSIAVTTFLKNLKLNDKQSKIFYVTANLIGVQQLKNVPYITNLLCINKKNVLSIFKVLFILIFGDMDLIIFDQSFYCFPTLYKRIISWITPFAKHIAFEKKCNEKYFDKVIDCLEQKDNVMLQYEELIEYIYGKKHNYDSELELFLNYKKEIPFVKKIFRKKGINNKDKIVSIFLSGEDERLTPSGIIHRSRDNDKWIEVIKHIQKKKYKIFLIGGKDNIKPAEYIKNKIRYNGLFNLTGKTNLEQSTVIIAHSDIFLCTDSGPMYIAMSLKRNIIALLHTGAPNFDQYISCPIRNDNVKDIEVSGVISLIDKCFLDVQ